MRQSSIGATAYPKIGFRFNLQTFISKNIRTLSFNNFRCSENHRYIISIMLVVIKSLPYFGYQNQIKQGFGN